MPRLNYKKLAPRPFEALSSLGHYVHTETTLEHPLLGLVYLRASINNGCAFCIGMHTAELLHYHEPQTRIHAVRDWQASDAFTLRERAALAWTDAITNIQQTHASDADLRRSQQVLLRERPRRSSHGPSPALMRGTASGSPSPRNGRRTNKRSLSRR